MDTERERFRITASRALSEHVDGAWWPRSKDLTTELPELLGAVHTQIGPVVLVAYPNDGWSGTPPEVSYGTGHCVRLLGFESAEPSSLILIGEGGHHVTLQLIAPETDEERARQTLDAVPVRPVTTDRRSAAAARSLAEVAKKLAEHEGSNDPNREARILDWCEAASTQFDDARIQTFVPILVEHIVNNRLHQERHARSRGEAGAQARS